MSNTTINKPMPKIGVDKYTFFPVTTDSSESTTYGAPVALPGVAEIAPTDAGGSEVFSADNGAYCTTNYLEKLGHEITNADIPPAVDAMWRGVELKNGGVEVDGNTKTVYFGVTWRVLKADNTYRYIRYYKGSYSFAPNVGGKTKPAEGAPEMQTAQATYTAVQRDSDGKYLYYIDESDLPAGITREQFETEWFSDMDYYPTAE